MLKLTAPPTGLIWLDVLPGVRVGLRPVSIAAMLLVREAAGNVYCEAALAEEPPDEKTTQIKAAIAMVRRIAHAGIVEWEGVGDKDGKPVPVTPENVDLLLDVWPAYDVIDRKYVYPAQEQEAEKTNVERARWHFDGGLDYCRSCTDQCSCCPYVEHAPQTEDGLLAWAVIERCAGQARAVRRNVYGLDFGAVLMLADAMDARTPLLADVLPAIER